MTIITTLLLLALAFTFVITLHLVVEPPKTGKTGLISDRLHPAASTTRGILFDRNGVPRRYY